MNQQEAAKLLVTDIFAFGENAIARICSFDNDLA